MRASIKAPALAVGFLLLALCGTVQAAGDGPGQVALGWVKAMRSGNVAGACRLQTEAEVRGTPCGSLPRLVHHCPKQTGGARRVAARTVSEQVGKASTTGSSATVPVMAERRRSHFRALLSLTNDGGAWRIASISGGGEVLSPAGLLVPGAASPGAIQTPSFSWGSLWLSCVQPVFPAPKSAQAS